MCSTPAEDMIELQALMLEQRLDDTRNAGLCVPGETVSYQEAGLEEEVDQPLCGSRYFDPRNECSRGGVPEYIQWFSDGEDSRYETN